jgi:hypothetical protein
LKLGADGALGFVTSTRCERSDSGAFQLNNSDVFHSFEGHTIHVRKKGILKRRGKRQRFIGPLSIIHEATHRFAQTTDYDRIGYRENDDTGWLKPEQGNRFQGPLTHDQALRNADSYAWFAYKVGRLFAT